MSNIKTDKTVLVYAPTTTLTLFVYVNKIEELGIPFEIINGKEAEDLGATDIKPLFKVNNKLYSPMEFLRWLDKDWWKES